MLNFNFFNKLVGMVVTVLIFISPVYADTSTVYPIIGLSGDIDEIAKTKLDTSNHARMMFIGVGKQVEPGLYQIADPQSCTKSKDGSDNDAKHLSDDDLNLNDIHINNQIIDLDSTEEKNNPNNSVLKIETLFDGSNSISITNTSPDNVIINGIYSVGDNRLYVEELYIGLNQIKKDFLIKSGESQIFNFEDFPNLDARYIDNDNFAVVYSRNISPEKRTIDVDRNGDLINTNETEEEKRKILEKLVERETPVKLVIPSPAKELKEREKKVRDSVRQSLYGKQHEKEKAKMDYNEERSSKDNLAVSKNSGGINKNITPPKNRMIVDASGMTKTLSEKGKSSNGEKYKKDEKGDGSLKLNRKSSKKTKKRKQRETMVISTITHCKRDKLPHELKGDMCFTLIQVRFVEKLLSSSKAKAVIERLEKTPGDSPLLGILKYDDQFLNDELGYVIKEIQKIIPDPRAVEYEKITPNYFYLSKKQLAYLKHFLKLIKKGDKKKLKRYLPKNIKKKLSSGKKVFKEKQLKRVKHADEKIMKLVYGDLDKLIDKTQHILCMKQCEKCSNLGWNIYETGSKGIYIAQLHFVHSYIADLYVHLLTESGLPAMLMINKELSVHVILVIIDLSDKEKEAMTKSNFKKAVGRISHFFDL